MILAVLWVGCDAAPDVTEHPTEDPAPTIASITATASRPSGIVPFDVTYTALGPWEWNSGVRVGRYEWTFEDGTTATGATVAHTVMRPGDVQATVKFVLETTGASVASAVVTVNSKGGALPKSAVVKEVTPRCPPHGFYGTYPNSADCDRTIPTVVDYAFLSGRVFDFVYFHGATLEFEDGRFKLMSGTSGGTLTRQGSYEATGTSLTLSLDEPLPRWPDGPLTSIKGTLKSGEVQLEWLPVMRRENNMFYLKSGIFVW